MAEDSDLEKTEPASPRRLEKAREEGDVPRSRELATCTILLAAGAGFWIPATAWSRLDQHAGFGAVVRPRASLRFRSSAGTLPGPDRRSLIALGPLLLLLVVVALAPPLLIGGWLFSPRRCSPNSASMNPMNGLEQHGLRPRWWSWSRQSASVLVGVVAWLVMCQPDRGSCWPCTSRSRPALAHLAALLVMLSIAIVAGAGADRRASTCRTSCGATPRS